MSNANIQVLKNMFQCFRAGDSPGFLELLTDDVYWDHRGPEGPSFNQLYEGRDAVARFLAGSQRRKRSTGCGEQRVFSSGDRVVCLGFVRFRAIATSNEWESDFAMAVTVRDGKLSHWRIFFDMGIEAKAITG